MRSVIAVVAEQRRQFMLEAAGFDRAMHPAFLGRSCLPPPTPGARILTLFDRARARTASDRGVALVVELVVRDVVRAYIVPHLVFGPIGEWGDFYDSAMVVIDFDFADIRARRPLVAAQ